jgi:hypothetical protein
MSAGRMKTANDTNGRRRAMFAVRASPAIAAAALFLAGCGSSSPASSANSASYTVTPKRGLNGEVFVTFDGPPAAARSAMRAFQATRKGGYVLGSTPVGQSNCSVAAAGGKVTISVVTAVGLNQSVPQTLCSAIRGRF